MLLADLVLADGGRVDLVDLGLWSSGDASAAAPESMAALRVRELGGFA